jgi:hypothetical protein
MWFQSGPRLRVVDPVGYVMKSNPDPESPVVEYEMGYAADEFGNVLRGPFSGEKSSFDCVEIKRHHWSIEHPGDFNLEIQVVEKPPRKIALFSLPVLQVIFSFSDTDASLRENFFHRFHQYFHKGGG